MLVGIHEVFDDTVELGALVAEPVGELRAILLDTSRESTEVLDCLRDGLCAKLFSANALA